MKNESTSASNADVNFLLGGGEMGARMRERDWSKTSLGPTQQWPQSLKTAVRIMLTCRQAMFVWWGEELINLYNDAYKAIIGGKHPEALGQPAFDVWREIWDQVGPRAESAMVKNEGTYDEALLLIMERNGYPEETYYTFSYSPVPNDQGNTGGIICANTDDTQRIIGERQLALLRELAARTADARTFDEACTLSANCLESNPYDLPFAMIYLVDPDRQQVFLAGTCRIEQNHVAVPETVDLNSDSVWPFAEVIRTHQAKLISDLEVSFSSLPCGVWQRSPHQAIAVPIAPSGHTGKAGILIVGLNPFRLFDDNYKRFIDLVAAQIAASIANAQAYEEERKRAQALAEIDRAKTVFFSNVSHEFRTPLTLMLGPLEETLANCATLLPANEREQLEMVQRNGLRLLKLVNSLLDFSRIEAGRVQASYEPTDLATFTAELASVFRSAVERAGMELSVNCPSLPAPVYVDREMWEKIVLNLLSNAFKFTMAGKIAVSLQWANDRIELAVQDTGIGIPVEEIPHLFERFHRVKGAQGRTFEGSGIGLSLVQELVQMHGGTVKVTSILGAGSCFTISIPTGYAHLPPDRISAPRTLASTALGATPYLEEVQRWLPEESRGSRGRREAGGEEIVQEDDIYIDSSPASPASPAPLPLHSFPRILLADDNADMRDYVKRLLGQQYEVESVADGLAALDSARGRVPDLILTDVMMPELDGFGLLQELRADPQTRKVPIILLSARAGEEARVEGLKAGADDYLIKPFSSRELLARVEAALKMARLREEAMQREQGLRIEAEVAKAHLETVLAGIQDQFYVLDREWRYTFVNDRLADVVGIQKKDLLGRIVWEVFPDLVKTEFYTQVHRAIAQQTVVRFEYFHAPWKRWFENRLYPFGEGISIFVTEISDRKQAEKALRESEEQFRNMADNAPFMVWVTDIAGYCTYLSKSWYDFTDQTEEMGLGFGWLNAVHPEDYDDAKNIFLEAKSYCSAFRMEYRLRRKDGVYRWTIDAANPWFGVDGQFKGYIGSVIDITERKAAEAERDRLLQLEQAARTEAERANRIKDEFLAVLSHELRSPLNPILGWARLLQTREFHQAEIKKAIATIERNAKLQAQLIEDLLDVSRILQGKLNLNMLPVNLVLVIEAGLETVRLAAEAKDIQIKTMLDASLAHVLGDSGRLQQVIWNLLSNAVKFTPEGGKIAIQLERIDTQAQITVSDTGKGIDPEFIPYVFEYFRQADSTTTRRFGGLGLGLAIVRHLIELHGGTIWAESLGEGQGAIFTVRLPLIKKELTPKEQINIDRLNDSSTTEILTGIKILVVDDDDDTREFHTFVLEQEGARVIAVVSAKEALQVLAESEPDILLSDIGMPETDGYMLMRQVRALQALQAKQIPAIALTAYAGEINQQQALESGFQRHLSKPVEPEELVKAIATLIGRNGNV
ncbi:ATP-binding protein [Nostoc sp. 'Peltigera membranacea cyanobiont' N6]|uniref:ATP-binding protein n=1 Tax=Nostoc sp. 'Peltigera membranacea cyanobiont' N6 TaxID=1261031 RepID=UPI000CF314BB|nr:ATP-binding protein [Nostoc sp. 'Peltigera membranacea cyanobiont' N6]AVH67496.1 multi-sensor hybrid histidine kinase [Nostoc sp. 'Peltigera membranacea cyanobiont' N6]